MALRAADQGEAMLAAVVRASLDCIVLVDEAGKVLEFNPAAQATFGYGRDAALGRSVAELIIPPSRRQAHAEGMTRYLAGGEPRMLGRRMQVEAMRADGGVIPVELTVTELKVGPQRLFAASMRDVSEQRDVAATLSAFMQNAPIGMYVKDAEGRYLMLNPPMAKVFGRPVEEVLGRTAADLFGLDEAEMIAGYDRALLASGKPSSVVEHLPGQTDFEWTLVVRFPIETDYAPPRIAGFDIDISTQKRIEEELRESERRFRTLSEFHPIPVTFVSGRSGRFLMANPAYHQMMRLPMDRAGELDRVSWFASPAERERVFQLVQTGEPVDGLEVEVRRYDGEVFWASISWRWIEMDGERVLVSSFVDLTDRKAAEAELERSREALHQSEKLTALGSLLAGVSHELNNPLAVVVGEAAILKEDAAGTALADSAARIQRAADRCSRIVQTFLAMARQRSPQRARVDLNELAHAALELTAYGLRTAGVQVTEDLEPGLPPLFGDSDQLHQVMVNLVINAQQALQEQPPPRRLTVRTRLTASGRVALEVADNGPGVPPDVARRIFEPFFTTKPQGVGTGVGLSFSQGIVEAHGGELRLVPPGPGEGAVFRLELPIGLQDGDAPAAAAHPEPAGKGRILVVDDEPEVAAVLARLLQREGFETLTAESGEAAMQALQAGGFAAVVSDLRMPGIDGQALLAWIQQARPELVERVGFVTGDTLGPSAASFLAASGRPFIEKPFDPGRVRTLLRSLIPAD